MESLLQTPLHFSYTTPLPYPVQSGHTPTVDDYDARALHGTGDLVIRLRQGDFHHCTDCWLRIVVMSADDSEFGIVAFTNLALVRLQVWGRERRDECEQRELQRDGQSVLSHCNWPSVL